MARVFRMIATDRDHDYFEPSLIDGTYHVATIYGGPRTLCGIQLDGDDGVDGGEEVEGPVTCHGCLLLIREIKAIENYEPTPSRREGGKRRLVA